MSKAVKHMKMGPTRRRASGFSLVELMIAVTIGLLLLSGLAMIFVNSSESNRELQRTAQQIENGRYAIDLLTQDLHVAGFYGHLHDVSVIPQPSSLPDPCESSNLTNLRTALWYPVQGYAGTIHAAGPASDVAPDLSATGCTTLLNAANLKPGSDVLVIRRADTNHLRRPGEPGYAGSGDASVSNVVYIQSSATEALVQVGNGSSVELRKGADGTEALFLNNGAATPPGAPVRRYRVHIYFVAPCSVGTGAGGACTGAAGEDRIPTLKRLELDRVGSFVIVPLVEGVDYLKVEYGIDNLPPGRDRATLLPGDGAVDSFTPTPAAADWTNVIAARIYVLARNTEPTQGFVDDKTYTLGSISVPARNDNFRRHVYAATVQLTNPAGRRESPDPSAPRLPL
jgi:type IV pilus assembly protein PilW